MAYARDGYAQEIGRGVRRANKHRQHEAEQAGTATYAKVTHWTPGQLRHTKATELRKMKNLEAARAILGHSSCVVTQIYAEMNEEPAIELARTMG